MDTTEDASDELRIADHKLIRCIGRGSYGQVWLAQNVIGAFRAVKIIRRKDFEDGAPYQRELNGIERFEPISRSHPGFINVLQVGQDAERGYFYYVMELGDDASGQFSEEHYRPKTIESVLRSQQRFSVDEVIRFGLRLTDALQTLHERNLIHRDIKPSNILFVGGIPKLADIGLVTRLGEAQSLVGTPGYIPPEGPSTPQGDIYALGKVFYESLTGLDRNRFPDLPSFFDGHSQEARFWEINEILSRACHYDPAIRYATAREFHAELTAVENGESVVRLRELERKWASAKRWSRVAGVAALVLGSLIFAAIREWTQAERGRQQTVGIRIASSLQAVEDGSYATALRDIAQVLAVTGDERSRRINRLRYATILGQMPKLTLLQAYGTRVLSAEFVRDAESLLISTGDGRCQMIDSQSGDVLVDFVGHTDAVYSAILSPDGQQVATAGLDGTARTWDRRTGRQINLFPHGTSILAIAFHPHEPWLAVGGGDGIVTCWNTTTAKQVFELPAHDKRIDCVRFSHNGKLMVTTARDNQARIWDAATREAKGPSIHHQNWVACAAFSPDDQHLATGCHDNAAYVWEVDSHRLIAPPIRHARAVRHIEFSPDGRCLLTSGWDNIVKQWNPSTGDPEDCSLKHSSPVMSANYSPDGRRIVTACVDGTLRIWDQTGKAVPRVLNSSIHALSGNGNVFLCLTGTNLAVYQIAHPHAPRTLIPFAGRLSGTFLSPDGTLVATITQASVPPDIRCRVWRTDAPPALVAEFPVSDPATRVAFDYAGGTLVVSSSQRTEKVSFGLTSIQRWPLLTNAVSKVVFSADNRSLALVAGSDVFVFDFEKRKLRFPVLEHRTSVNAAAFSPDENLLVTCTGTSDVQACYAQVWDAANGRPVGPRRWHADGVEGTAWFPSSEKFITVGEDGVGRIWSATGRAPIGPELKHNHEIESVEVDPSAGLILTAGQDLAARLWDLESAYPIGPALRFPKALYSVRFSSHDAQVVAHDWNGVLFLASATATEWPQPVLHALADLLDGRLTSPGTGDEFQAGTLLASEWQRWKRDLPGYFNVSSEQVLAWHRMEKERCRAVKHRRGELFHLEHVLRFVPDDRTLLSRRAYLQSLLAAEERALQKGE